MLSTYRPEFRTLRARARRALVGLRYASEAGTQLLAATVSHSKPEHRAPPPQEDLYGHHKAAYEDWFRRRLHNRDYDKNLDRFRELVAATERDLDETRYRTPARVDSLGRRETSEERDARLLEDYAGVHYCEAAARERVHPQHLYRLREQARREPVGGQHA